MSDTTQAPNSISRVALSAAPHSAHILAPSFGCLGLSIVFSDDPVGLAFLAIGLALLTLLLLIRLLEYRHKTVQNRVWDAASKLCMQDATPCVATDEAGEILFRNPAAEERYPGQSKYLSSLLDHVIAAPHTIVNRMRAHAVRDGSVVEDISLSGRVLQISALSVEGCGVLWRFADQPASREPNQASAVAQPMMLVNPSNEVLDLNEAMHAFLGNRPKTLDRIVAKLPLKSGATTIFDTANGSKEAQLAIYEQKDGNRQIFVWPLESHSIERASAASIPVPLLRISPDGMIEMANPKAQKLLALPDGARLDFAETVEAPGRPIKEWLLDVVDGRNTGRTEVVRAALPEQDVYLQVSLGRMVEHGEVSILAVLIDATELKTLEAQFVQSQKMQAIGQLAGGVAHDFNNLLTAISGHCDLLLLRHQPGDPNYGDLVQINQNANRAASLVGQLLAFSRKQNMQPELIDLRDTLGDLTHLLNRLVGEKINLKWKHDVDLPRVRADKRQLEQVLMNLVVNARDAMPSGGTIEVETSATSLDTPLLRDRAEVPAGEYVVVMVRDEGCGIAADKLQKIFEPFYSTKKTGEGTGLGLSMAYGIVKQSGGFIFADSVLGKGSTFTMYFPAHYRSKAVEPSSPPAVTRSLVPQEGGHVLLVEDETPVRAFASRALRLRGYTVTEASCAEDALSLLEDETLAVDVFVTDVVMPGMDGPTWVAKALEARPNVKVVFVSGYAEDSVSHNRAKIPNSTFLPKPFSLSQLTEAVQAQLNAA